MATMATNVVTIDALLPCDYPSCAAHAEPLFTQLNVPRYSEFASVLAVPETLAEWRSEHRTARRRALRAERLGYVFAEVDYSQHGDDMFVINTSLSERQGRPMSAGYITNRPRGPLTEAQTRCPLHRTHTYGVLKRGKLVAYLTLHRAGELAMVSMILGHGDHMPDGIMFLLFQGVVEQQAGRGGSFFYNRHDSGKDGLVWMKERLGFRPAEIEWSLS